MERQQSLHRSRQPKAPRPTRSNQRNGNPKAMRSGSRAGLNLSLVLLGSAWVAIVMIALTAISGLLSPNLSSSKTPQGNAAVRATTSEVHRTSQSHLPLWLFGAIALSCAAGSMLISAQANRPARPRKTAKPKRLASYVAPETREPLFPTAAQLPRATQPHVETLASLALISQAHQKVPTAAPFMAPTTLMQLAQQVSQPSGQAVKVPAPAAIGSEDKTPLDWGEASLADRLDIRKPRSVSPLL